jgi:hypothetical protein
MVTRLSLGSRILHGSHLVRVNRRRWDGLDLLRHKNAAIGTRVSSPREKARGVDTPGAIARGGNGAYRKAATATAAIENRTGAGA